MAEVQFSHPEFSQYPQQLRASTEQPTIFYQRQPGYYAVHYQQAGQRSQSAILSFNEGAIAVFAGDLNNPETLLYHASAQDIVSPVYASSSGGSFAVPTGLIFIRFAQGVDIMSYRQAIERAGYEITETLPYAAQAAWLRVKSARIWEALQGISRLEAIQNVENVEPQLLMERSFR